MNGNQRTVRVAVDVMGGDHAPQEIVSGAIDAAKELGVKINLVGDPLVIRGEIDRHDVSGLPIEVTPSQGVIHETDQPARALRQKPHASIVISTGLVKKGLADASVTMGSTGAAMATAAVMLGVFDGIDRPSLGGPIIGLASHTMILDVGTNVDCRASQLLSFGVIGSVFARKFWQIEKPRVALLSVGAEAGKGNRQVKEASALFSKSGLYFIGNLEANDLPYDKADVVVCDGFVGNIVMKLSEGLGSALSKRVKTRLDGKISVAEGGELATEIYELTNVTEAWGGGPLLGVNGVSIVGHGRAKSDSVKRAIETAKQAVEVDLVPALSQELARLNATNVSSNSSESQSKEPR